MLAFTGCTTKEPAIDATAETTTTEVQPAAAEVTTETVGEDIAVIDEDGVAGVDINEMTMSGLEAQMQSINFDFDKFNIRPDMEGKIQNNIGIANGDAKEYMIKLEGNCDEWGSDEYNYALGLKRANATKTAMVNDGVDANRITMVSYGESNPVCSDKSRDCWAKNRRLDFKLLP
jgi:peptidoglycan-associated lipoprotein